MNMTEIIDLNPDTWEAEKAKQLSTCPSDLYKQMESILDAGRKSILNQAHDAAMEVLDGGTKV